MNTNTIYLSNSKQLIKSTSVLILILEHQCIFHNIINNFKDFVLVPIYVIWYLYTNYYYYTRVP